MFDAIQQQRQRNDQIDGAFAEFASLASRNNSKISFSSMLPSNRSLRFKPQLDDNRRDYLGALRAIILYLFISSGPLWHFSILCSGVQLKTIHEFAWGLTLA
jgi:hypothetical protein